MPVTGPGGEAPDGELGDLIEKLSRLAHETWMEKRLAEGWERGPQNRDAKTTPLLVPYDELPESEKETDRVMVRGTVGGIRDSGWRLEPPSSGQALSEADRNRLQTLRQHLEAELKRARDPNDPRSRDFDMNDGPELAVVDRCGFQVLGCILRHFGAERGVGSKWAVIDKRALDAQRNHRRVARFAIWPTVLAIIAAVLQLAAHCMEHETGLLAFWTKVLLPWFEQAEIWAVGIATVAVVLGLVFHVHGRRIDARAGAEMLRNLKFASLASPEVWVGHDAWRASVDREAAELEKLGHAEVEKFALEADAPAPADVGPPTGIDPAECAAVAIYYEVKRLEFQRHYFGRQAEKAKRKSWGPRYHASAWIFLASVVAVLAHVFLRTSSSQELNFVVVAIAAGLPVAGFGLRAWLAAFETPRTANLFRAKAAGLEGPIINVRRDAADPGATLNHIARNEHFFLGEHKEWCRLQLEAEWFL